MVKVKIFETEQEIKDLTDRLRDKKRSNIKYQEISREWGADCEKNQVITTVIDRKIYVVLSSPNQKFYYGISILNENTPKQIKDYTGIKIGDSNQDCCCI